MTGDTQQASGSAGSSLGTTIKYLRRLRNGFSGSGLGTTVNYLRQTTAAGNRLATTNKYLRGAAGIGLGIHMHNNAMARASQLSKRGVQTSGAAFSGLRTSIKHLRRTTSGAAGNGLCRCQGLLTCPFTTSALHSPCLLLAFFANKTEQHCRITCDKQLPRAIAWPPRSSTCVALWASAWAPRLRTRDAQRRNGQSITVKYVRRTTSGAASNVLGTSIKYLRRTTSGTAGNGLTRCQGFLMCPFTKSFLHLPCLLRAFFANKQNSTAEDWG
jgi:hypothetical protein